MAVKDLDYGYKFSNILGFAIFRFTYNDVKLKIKRLPY